MVAVVRRQTAAGPAPVSFGKREDYSQSNFNTPDGKYALEFMVMMYTPRKANGSPVGPERLGVMVKAHSLTDTSAEVREQHYSMGKNAHKSFAPNPETGKGLVRVPDGAGVPLNPLSSWGFFHRSMIDCDPTSEDVFENDISVWDGVHVQLTQIPEPDEWKNMPKTAVSEAAEAAGDKPKDGPRFISVVSEVIAAPWVEGSGAGIPEAGEAPTAPAKPAPAGKAAPKPASKPATPPPAPESNGGSEEEVMEAAVAGMTVVLTDSPDGCPQLALRTKTFAHIKKAYSEDMANAVANTFFGTTEAINSILEQLGYKSDGKAVKIA